MLLFIIFFLCQSKPRFDGPTPKSCWGHKGGSVGVRESPKDPTHTHTHRLKRSRLGLTRLASEGVWIGPNNPSLRDLPPVKFRGNMRSDSDDFSFWLQTLFGGACSLGFGQNLTNMFLMCLSIPL